MAEAAINATKIPTPGFRAVEVIGSSGKVDFAERSRQVQGQDRVAAINAAARIEQARSLRAHLARGGEGYNMDAVLAKMAGKEVNTEDSFKTERAGMQAALTNVSGIEQQANTNNNGEYKRLAEDARRNITNAMDLTSGMELLRITQGAELPQAFNWNTPEGRRPLASALGIPTEGSDQAQLDAAIHQRLTQLATDHGIDLNEAPAAPGGPPGAPKTEQRLVEELNGRIDRAIDLTIGGPVGTIIQDELKELGFTTDNAALTKEVVAQLLANPSMRAKVYELIDTSEVKKIGAFAASVIVNLDENDAAVQALPADQKTARIEALRKLKTSLEGSDKLENVASKAASEHVKEVNDSVDQGFEKYLTEVKDTNLAALMARWRDVSYDEDGKVKIDKRTARANMRADLTTILRHPDNDLGLKIVIARSIAESNTESGIVLADSYDSLDDLRKACGPGYAAVEQIYNQHANEIKGKMFQRFVGLRGMSDVGLINAFGEGGLYFNRRALEGLATYFGDVPEEFLRKNPEAQKLLKRIDKSRMENLEGWQKFGLWMLLGLMVAGGAAATAGIAGMGAAGAAGAAGLTGLTEAGIGATAYNIEQRHNP